MCLGVHAWLGFGGGILLLAKGGGGAVGGRVGGPPGKEKLSGLKMHSGVFSELKSPVCERYYKQYFIQNVRYANTLILLQQINS